MDKTKQEYVKELVFLQGDDASEIFGIMYPEGKSNGSKSSFKAAIDHMLAYTTQDSDHLPRPLDSFLASGILRTRHHVLMWNYARNWVGLYLKVSKKDMKKDMKKEYVKHG